MDNTATRKVEVPNAGQRLWELYHDDVARRPWSWEQAPNKPHWEAVASKFLSAENAALKEQLEVARQIEGSFWVALKPLNLTHIHVQNPGQHITDLISDRDGLKRVLDRIRLSAPPQPAKEAHPIDSGQLRNHFQCKHGPAKEHVVRGQFNAGDYAGDDRIEEAAPAEEMVEVWVEVNGQRGSVMVPKEDAKHVCGSHGFGYPGDICRACDARGRAEEIARAKQPAKDEVQK